MESLEIEIDVNESYINRVEAGQAVEATLDAYPEWRIPCKVIAIIPTADRQKSTVKVRVGFDNWTRESSRNGREGGLPGKRGRSEGRPHIDNSKSAVQNQDGHDMYLSSRTTMLNAARSLWPARWTTTPF